MKISKGRRAYLIERMRRFAFYHWGARRDRWAARHGL